MNKKLLSTVEIPYDFLCFSKAPLSLCCGRELLRSAKQLVHFTPQRNASVLTTKAKDALYCRRKAKESS